jgi:tetratricopeptide (TPR) repeat protein
LNLGHIYRKQNKLVAAENIYLKALKLAASSKEYIIYEGQLSQGLGILYLEMNRLPKAKFYLDYSMNLYRNQQITSMIAEVLLGYGRYFERTNQAEEAIKSYEEGIGLADQVKSIDLKVEFSDYLYKIFKAQKSFEKELYYIYLNL